jgi:hypothetical protein
MAFSVFVEMLNLRLRKKSSAPVELHTPYVAQSTKVANAVAAKRAGDVAPKGPARPGPGPGGKGRRR